MGTKATFASHDSDGEALSWDLYEEVFEPGCVYLKLSGVAVELTTSESGGADVVLRLPLETARQLGLHANVPPDQWKRLLDEGGHGD